MKFEKEYFINSNTGNYKDYTKKKFKNLCEDLITYFDIKPEDKIIDFGCATGGLIKEFVEKGYTNIKGTDVSYWAIQYGMDILKLKNELNYYNIHLLTEEKDYLFLLDVLEHIPSVEEIKQILILGKKNLRKKMVIRIPVSRKEGEPYVYDVSRNDITHVQCHSINWWIDLFNLVGLKIKEFLYCEYIFTSRGVLAVELEIKDEQ
jgi:hypothetical protein